MKLAVLIVVVILLAVLLGAGLFLYTPDKPRAALEAKYHVTPADYLDVAGIRLHVRDTGPRDAQAVILLHGFGSSLETWDEWADALSDQFRVIRYDLPGFGLTGPDPTGDYTDARSVQVLAALMDRLGIAKAAIVGNSMGGKLAWTFAADHPERVTKLVLVSPDGFASPGFEYGKKPDVPATMKLLPYVLPTFMLRASLVPAYADKAMLTDALVGRYRDMMLAPGVRGAIVDRMGQYMPENPEPQLAHIKAPTLLIWGEKDGMIPFTNAQDYLRAIPNSRLAAFPDLGHIPQEEAPARSLAPLREFLSAP
jgi:pimeloyl-ACP methyl ester carboxylesterase